MAHEQPATSTELVALVARCVASVRDDPPQYEQPSETIDALLGLAPQSSAERELSKAEARRLEQEAREKQRLASTAADAALWAAAMANDLGSGALARAKAAALATAAQFASAAEIEAREAQERAQATWQKTVQMRLAREKHEVRARAESTEVELKKIRAELELAREELRLFKEEGESAVVGAKMERAAIMLQSRSRGKRARQHAVSIDHLREQARLDHAKGGAGAGAAVNMAEEAWAILEEKLEAAAQQQLALAQKAVSKGAEMKAKLEAKAKAKTDGKEDAKPEAKGGGKKAAAAVAAAAAAAVDSSGGKLSCDASFFSFGGTDDFLRGLDFTERLDRSMEEEFRENLDGKFYEEYRYIVYRSAEEDVDAEGAGPLSSTTAKFLHKVRAISPDLPRSPQISPSCPCACLTRGCFLHALLSRVRCLLPPPQTSTRGRTIVRDDGHAGMRLEDFARLEKAIDAELTIPEVAALRLYTGPAYAPINSSLRARGGSEWRTTISLLYSGVLKLSTLSAPARVYRGVREVETVLPPSFLDGAFAGGVELAFMSTTLDPCVAIDYSGGAFTAGSLFVIDFDMASRGAAINWLSQYPAEEELLFPPCTGLSCTGYSVRGAKRLICLKPSVSTKRPDTDELVNTKYVPGTNAALERLASLLGGKLAREGREKAREMAAQLAVWSLAQKNLSYLEAQKDLALLLGRAQHALPNLKNLELSHAQLGDAGLVVVAESIAANKQLEHLGVANNDIGLQGATALAAALAVNTTLTSIDVRGCDADEISTIDDSTRNAMAVAGQALTEVKEQACLRVLGEAVLSNPHSALGYGLCDAFEIGLVDTGLTVEKGRGSAGAATLLASLLAANAMLVELDVRKWPIVGEPARRLATAVLASPRILEFSKLPLSELRETKAPIETIKVQQVPQVGPTGGIVLASVARDAPALTTLLMPHNRIGSEGGEAMAALLRHNKKLTHLDVRSNGIFGAAAHKLASAVLASPSLAIFGGVPLKKLKEKTEEHLVLINEFLGPSEARVLAGLLRQKSMRLTSLNLDRNQILSEGVRALAEALHTNTGLTDLKINDNGTDGEAAPALAKMLTMNTTLRELNVGGNRLGKEGGGLIADALAVNKTLTRFLALGVKFPPQDLERLRRVRDTRVEGVDQPLEVKVASLDSVGMSARASPKPRASPNRR